MKLYYQVLNTDSRFQFTMCCVVTAGGLAHKFQEAGIEVISLKCKKNHDPRQIRDIMRIIRGKKIDIVHTHFARSNTYGRIAAILTGKLMIVSEHGIARNVSLPMYFFDTFLNLFTSHLVCNSYATLHSVKNTVLLNRRNMSVIYNGVPDPFKGVSELFKEELKKEHGFERNDFIILDVGSHIFSRNHITLIKAASKLRTRIPEMKVILIGDGPAHTSLVDAVKELRLVDQIFFWKNTAREKVHRFMPCADIYVNPAICEGFGIATVEAMLCELPIICANSGSLPELIADKREGLLFDPKNADDLCQSILELYQSKGARSALGKMARKRAVKEFSVERFTRAFEKKYLSMVKS